LWNGDLFSLKGLLGYRRLFGRQGSIERQHGIRSVPFRLNGLDRSFLPDGSQFGFRERFVERFCGQFLGRRTPLWRREKSFRRNVG
jgi:hypothetical protein